MDAVADRDFAAEFCFAAALIGVHLSRLGEEVVLWSSQEFGWIELDDAYATGSSIMPQKKNPDVAELARGKAGRLIGDLTGAADHAQGPAARLQPRPAGGQGAGVRRGRHAAPGAARDGRADRHAARSTPGGCASWRRRASPSATDLAEYLVQRGVPFREAHEIVGHLVVWCQVNEVGLDEVSDADLAKVSPHLTPDVRSVLTVDGAIAARKGVGGTAPDRVAEQLTEVRVVVDDDASLGGELMPGSE